MAMTTRRWLRGLVAALSVSIVAGAAATELTVSAASSLTNALREIAPLYEAARPGAKVRLNFAASGALLQQINQGAPVDLFASADQETMDQAAKGGRVAQRRDFVSNALVVVVPKASPRVPGTLADLAQPAFARIAIGLPASAPVGRYAKAALEAAELWTTLEPKLITAYNVRQALDYVARGEVDAAFVYATDAALLPDKVRVALTVATPRPIRYPIAVLAEAPHPADAEDFVEFLFTSPAQAVLAKYGFGRP
jgi:molybdate transport system substrate-binding protein